MAQGWFSNRIDYCAYLKENIIKYQPNSLKIVRYTVSSYAKFAKLVID